MTTCPHCHGRGVLHVEPACRGAALRKLPPYGREVELAAREGRLPMLGVMLFYRPDPANECRPARDAWTLARDANARRPGIAMVLPPDTKVAEYRWPAIPRHACDPQIAFFAYGCSDAEQRAIARDLIAAGYDSVAVLGGPGCPIPFQAA